MLIRNNGACGMPERDAPNRTPQLKAFSLFLKQSEYTHRCTLLANYIQPRGTSSWPLNSVIFEISSEVKIPTF